MTIEIVDFPIKNGGKHTKNSGKIHHFVAGKIHYFYGHFQ